MIEEVVLVNEKDEALGAMEKMAAHEQAILHRAFSVFVFNKNGDVLMQQRAYSKYHSGGLWTNTCCSHPAPDEETIEAAHSRLRHEMGFDCELQEIFSFAYRVELDNGMTEHEYDHVFIGKYNGQVKMNPEEASDYKWIDPEDLYIDMKDNSDNYTYWFKQSVEKVVKTAELNLDKPEVENR